MKNIEKNEKGNVFIKDKEMVIDKTINIDGDLLACHDLTIDGGDVLVSGDVYVKGTLTLKNGSLLIGGYLFTPRRIIEYGCNIKEEYEFDEEPDIKTNSKSFIKKLLRK